MKNRVLSTISLIANILIVLLVAFAVVSLYTPIFGEVDAEALKKVYYYFTIESCLFLALVSAIEIPFLIKSVSKRRYLVPGFIQALKLVAVTMTTLTMATALTWLAQVYGFEKMIGGVNLFLHLIIPALGLLTFAVFEAQSRFKIKHAFYVVIPMVLYILFYYGAVLVYDLGIKDWYRFGFNEYDADGNPVGDLNVLKAVLSVVIFLLGPAALSFLICLVNKLFYKIFFVRKPLPRPEDTRTPEGKKVVIIEDVKKEEKTEEKVEEEPAPVEEVTEPVEEETPAEEEEIEEEEAEEEPVKEEVKQEPVKKEAPKAKPAKKSAETKAKAKEEPAKKAPAKKAAQPVASSEFGKYEGKTRVYHIAQSKTVDGQWHVKLAGGDKAIKIFKTQKEAIEFAKGLVRTQGGSIRIHSMKGKLRK